MLLFSASVNAMTTCGPYKVLGIQTQSSGLLLARLQFPNGAIYWKKIGDWSIPTTKPYMAILMQAYAMKEQITLRYSEDNYNCDITDYGTTPEMIRISK